MQKVVKFLRSSIGKKQLMALTGLVFGGFLLSHMAGNLLLLCGPEAYNQYSENIVSNLPLLYSVEAILLISVTIHFFLAILIVAQNRCARRDAYARGPSGLKAASLASRTMILSGLLILAFLILHLWTFKYGTYYSVTYDGKTMRDLYKLVQEEFRNPFYVGWYVFSLIVLGLHLSHGFASCCQTLGISSVRNRRTQAIGTIVAWLIAGGFIAQPIYFVVTGGR